MDINIKYKPSYAMALVNLNQDESIMVESGAMVSKSTNIDIQTHRMNKQDGFLKSFAKSLVSGESFFMNTFTAKNGNGTIEIAPTIPGDIEKIELNSTIYVQASSYLAGHPDLKIETKFQGMKGFFSGESLFFMKIYGNGPLLLSSYGGIEAIDIDGEFIVDTGHIVAFEEGINYKVHKFGGWKTFLFSGEGLVCTFSGKGRIWVQSKNLSSLTNWFSKVLPPKQQ